MEPKLLKDDCFKALKDLQMDINTSTISKSTITLNLEDIDLNSISRKKLDIKLKELISSNDSPVIYRIINNNKEVSGSVYSAFAIAKKEKFENRSYSKLNEEGDNSLSNCLYVGTSQGKTFKKRIREHLGFGALSTYSMHMKAWLPANALITVEYFTVRVEKKSSYYNAVELLEQTLWMQEKPMFGKRSGLL